MIEIIIAILLMVLTTVIHAGGMIVAIHLGRWGRGQESKLLTSMRVFMVAAVILVLFVVAILQVLVWASAYVTLGVIEGFRQATYFSMVTFTTLGYGDVVPHEQWRLLASFQAANGIIMFGWTTAIVISTVQRVYFRNEKGD